MEAIQFIVTQVLSGAAAGAALVWLARSWISERLRQSISHEYSQRLETHKNDLEIRVQSLRHEFEVHQLRTSLFFDHQRSAFGELLAKIAEVNDEWWRTGYEDDVGLIAPVPSGPLRELRELYYRHQLFLDTESVMAMELLFETYRDSLPFDDNSGAGPYARDVREPYDNAEYLQPRIASLFQSKIGISSDRRSARQIALLGAIRIMNRYHFSDIQLPVGEPLKLKTPERSVEAVMKAERHFDLLLFNLRQFHNYLQTESAFFHEAELSLGRYLAVLDTAAVVDT
jgi:hypothetical protein